MFTLFYKPIRDWVRIYNVKDDNNGYPHFLILIDGQWKYISAKHFSGEAGY